MCEWVCCFIASRIGGEEGTGASNRLQGRVFYRDAYCTWRTAKWRGSPRQNVGSRRCWELSERRGQRGERRTTTVIRSLSKHTHTRTQWTRTDTKCVSCDGRASVLIDFTRRYCVNIPYKYYKHTIQIHILSIVLYTSLIIIITRHLLPMRLYISYISVVYLKVFKLFWDLVKLVFSRNKYRMIMPRMQENKQL